MVCSSSSSHKPFSRATINRLIPISLKLKLADLGDPGCDDDVLGIRYVDSPPHFALLNTNALRNNIINLARNPLKHRSAATTQPCHLHILFQLLLLSRNHGRSRLTPRRLIKTASQFPYTSNQRRATHLVHHRAMRRDPSIRLPKQRHILRRPIQRHKRQSTHSIHPSLLLRRKSIHFLSLSPPYHPAPRPNIH